VGLLTSVASVLLALAGVALVAAAWRAAPGRDPILRLAAARPVLAAAFGVDALYDRLLVRPVRAAARAVGGVDDEVIGGGVRGSGAGATRLAAVLARTQGGNVGGYLTGLLAGVVLVAVGVVTLT
jgi:NADH-quinone oxidoreductase subunit L